MHTTDTSEKGLESLIVADMTGITSVAPMDEAVMEGRGIYRGSGWLMGDYQDYNRDYAIDLAQLTAFLSATQPDTTEALDICSDSPTRQKFLSRLQGEITKRGTTDVLRHGVKHGPHSIDLFYGAPTPGNTKAEERYALNRFSVTRQLYYSRDETNLALDLCLFINGLPIATFELKNRLTKQTAEDAIEQYRRDRDPRELLFQFGRCIVHFAVDDQEVRFCTHLQGKASWFLPFNQGWNDGAGNPPKPDGIKTDYLWKRLLSPQSLTDILDNYVHVVAKKDDKSGRKISAQIFPRYHQIDVVRKLLSDVRQHGAGHRYLIQHSAGSGKSNSIAWLAHQLIALRKDDREVFDSIIVVTDRRILDQQIRDTIKQFSQVSATIGHAERSGDLRAFIENGKKIIISTVQKFPFILDEIGKGHRNRKFAIIIDEAHSSQGGKTSAAMSEVLADPEDTVNDALEARMQARKMLKNASYFAFTATPKNKTLEVFGDAVPSANVVQHRPFHSYTMKQAIQEGFILDVLQCYTPIQSYYRLVKTVESDPEFDTRRANKKLRRYVESHDYSIRLKAEIMVDHFIGQVIAQNKIGGQARAMVVTSGIDRAIQYFHAFQAYLEEIKNPFKAIVAFSGEHEYGEKSVTEASLNGFPSNMIAEKIVEDPYRFLICADKFQTGYDEPLLHTMYVDKILSGVKAVQTLSRLNRAHPKKHDVFVLDFMNDTDMIEKAFADYYRTTILSEETDPNKLHDLKSALDGYQVYSPDQIDKLVNSYLSGASREMLDPILDVSVEYYIKQLNEDEQVDFKGKAKSFVRTYSFLSAILTYNNAGWEKLSIYLNLLIPKLPAPIETEPTTGLLDAIDMDSYRVEKLTMQKILLPDADAEISPVPVETGGFKPEPEMDYLSNILKSFNELFGNIPWEDKDRVFERINVHITSSVAADTAYSNARKQLDPVNARIESDKALERVMVGGMKDDTELFKQFSDNESFRKWLSDFVFERTYNQPTK